MRRLACVVLAMGFASIGCGDDKGGTGGTGGIIVPDASGGMGGTGGGGGMPDAGPPAGTRISSTGGQLVLVNKAQDHAAWLDLGNHAHVAPLNMGADPTPLNFTFTDLAATGAIGWVNNTLIINHGIDTSNGVGKFAVWTTGMADALDIQTSLNGVAAAARPIASVSPDGAEVGFSAPIAAAATSADVKIQAVATGSTATTIGTLGFDATNCGAPIGQFTSWTAATNSGTYVTLACDPGTTTGIHLRKITIAAGAPTPANGTVVSASGDDVVAFSLSVDNNRQVDGHFAAYLTSANRLKIVSIGAVTPTVIDVDTTLTLSQTSPFPIGEFHGNDIFYLAPNNVMKKATVNAGGTALTGTPVTVISNAVDWSGSSFDGNSFSADGTKVVYYTMIMTASNFTFGNMALISTAGGGTALTLNSDNKGYPGDNVFSKNGTYVWWYDAVDTTTTGIGTIHSRKADGSDSPQTVGPGGYFIRQTNTDNIAAVMSNAHAMGTSLTVGDLNRVDVTNAQATKITDQITYMDMVYPSGGAAKVVYTRSDGVYITDF